MFAAALVDTPAAWARELASRGAAPTHFLNKLSNAARASLALRGAGVTPSSAGRGAVPDGNASRATVTRARNSSQVLA